MSESGVTVLPNEPLRSGAASHPIRSLRCPSGVLRERMHLAQREVPNAVPKRGWIETPQPS